MPSVRERIIEKAVATLQAAGIGATVYRSRTQAISRDQTPAVIVRPAADSASQTVMPKLQWSLQLIVEIITRGEQPDALADPVLVAANAALMADPTFGGLVIQIVPKDAQFHFTDADLPACYVVAGYEVRYRTDERDLTIT